MHRLLKRQLKRSFGQEYEIPEQWRPLVEAVDEGYRQYDSDLTQIERSLDLSSGELMEANAEMRAVLQALPNIFLRLGKDGVILDCRTTEDSGVFRMWKALIGGPLAGALSPGLGAQFEAAMKRARAAQAMERFEYSLIVDGNRKFFEARVVPMPGGDTTAIMRDMTDQRLAEERRNAAAESLKQTNETLREKLSEIEKLNENLTAIQNQLLQSQEVMQHQKLESIGQLAGGVAHDLNNILQVISGHVEMALASERLDAELTDDLSRISNAAERATALIKQLLAFGKKQFLHRKNINLNKNLTDLVGLLRRIIKANVEIEFHVETKTDLVSADPMVLDQVLMNLCINARDAMPGGGKLTIRTSNVVEYGKTFLLISVTDTGAGIPPRKH